MRRIKRKGGGKYVHKKKEGKEEENEKPTKRQKGKDERKRGR